jgi:hypothetical protein
MKLNRQFALVPIFLALTACGGSSGSKSQSTSTSSPASSTSSIVSSTSSSVTVLSGRLIDSDVANVSYSTATQSGTTDSTGLFHYLAGETIIFSIGQLSFPAIQAAALLSPLELAGTDDFNDPKVINIARLLQTIDSDDDPSNGISVSDAAIAAMQTLDFSLPVDSFASQPGIDTLLAAINKIQLVAPDSAIAHLRETLGVAPSPVSSSSAAPESSSSTASEASSVVSSSSASSVSSVAPIVPASSTPSSPASSAAPSSVPASSSSIAPSSVPASSSSVAPSSVPASSSSVAPSSVPASSSSVAPSSVPASSSSVASSSVASSTGYTYEFPSSISTTNLLVHGRHDPYVASDAGPVLPVVFDENFNIVTVQSGFSQNLRKFNDPIARDGYSYNHLMYVSWLRIEPRLNQAIIWLPTEAIDSTGSSLIGQNIFSTSLKYIGLYDGSATAVLDRTSALAFFDALRDSGIPFAVTGENANLTKGKASVMKTYSDRVDEIRSSNYNPSSSTYKDIATKILEPLKDGHVSRSTLPSTQTGDFTFHEIMLHPRKGLGVRKITTDETADNALSPWTFHKWNGQTHTTREEYGQIIYTETISSSYDKPNFAGWVYSGSLYLRHTALAALSSDYSAVHYSFRTYAKSSLVGLNIRDFVKAYMPNSTLINNIPETATFGTHNGEDAEVHFGDMRIHVPNQTIPTAGQGFYWAEVPFTEPDGAGKCPEHGTYAQTVNFDGNCAAAPGWYVDGGQKPEVSFVDTLGPSERYAFADDHRWFKFGFYTTATPRMEANTLGKQAVFGLNNYVNSLASNGNLNTTTHLSLPLSTPANGNVRSFKDLMYSGAGLPQYQGYFWNVRGNVVRVGKHYAYGSVQNIEPNKLLLNDAAYNALKAYLED